MSTKKNKEILFVGLVAILGLRYAFGALFDPSSKVQEYEEVYKPLIALAELDILGYHPITELKESGEKSGQEEAMRDSPITNHSSSWLARDGVYQIIKLRTSALEALNNGNLALAKSKLHRAVGIQDQLLAANLGPSVEKPAQYNERVRSQAIGRAQREWDEVKKRYHGLISPEEMEQEFNKMDADREELYKQLSHADTTRFTWEIFTHWEHLGYKELNAAKEKLAKEDLSGAQQKLQLAKSHYETAKSFAKPVMMSSPGGLAGLAKEAEKPSVSGTTLLNSYEQPSGYFLRRRYKGKDNV